MREFDKPIGRVWRRMRAQRFLSALVWCLCGAAIAGAGLIGVAKLGLRIPGPTWVPLAAAAGLAGLAGLSALLIAICTGPTRIDAAIAIDHAFGLNERLATALTLPIELSDSSAGRALLADARKHIDGIDIRSKFGLRPPRRFWAPIIPVMVAGGLFLIPDRAQRSAEALALKPKEKVELAEQTKALSKTIAERRKELNKDFAPETDKLLAEIQKAAEDMAKSPPQAKDKAMMQLNKLSDAVEERRNQLAGADQVNKQIQQMKAMASDGPLDKLAKDLAQGDFEKAAKEVSKLKEKLLSGKLSEAEKKSLQEQISQLKKELEKQSNLEQRRKQLEQAKKNGAISQKQFEQEMAKLDQQSKNLQQMQKLAKALAQAENGMKQGDLKKAAEAMGMGQQQLQDLAKQMQELETLDNAMADLQDAKNGMNSEGMNQVGDRLDGMNSLGMGDGKGRRPGNGMGRGRGQGDRPEAPEDTAAYDTKVKQQITKGKAIFEGFAPPKGVTKGESQIDVQATVEAETRASEDALSNQKIPNSVRKHVKGYFDQIKESR